MTATLTAGLLAALDIAVLEPAGRGQFRVIGMPPAWLSHVWPHASDLPEEFSPQTQSPFLEHFLVEAARCWERRDSALHRSGVWVETDRDGNEWSLEATASCLEGRPLLIVQHAGASYRDTVSVLQRARENALQHQALMKEIEKKDVLLHCIVHDLRSPLISVKSLLSLLDEEPLAPKMRELLDVGKTQLERQDLLIRTILDVFAADVDGLRGGRHDAADIVECARTVSETFAPLFGLHNVALSLDLAAGAAAGLKVVGERTRLARVFANLVENALRHSKPQATVVLGIARDGAEAVATIDDEGPGVDPELSHRLFDRLTQGPGQAGSIGLGLHFCRITVEGWGGTIGQANRQAGGSRFWFRLPCWSAEAEREREQ